MTSSVAIAASAFNANSLEGRLIGKLVRAFREISVATVGALELDRELSSLLEEVTDGLRFEFATVALVDEYRRVIETVRVKNAPLGSRDLFKCPLDGNQMLADVVRTRRTVVVRGWDIRLNREIYERFGFDQAVQVFAPILAGEEAVGVIWAGCTLEKEHEIVTPQTVQAVEQLGKKRGAAVAKCRPYVLLEVIAQHAIGIIGADSASIHVYYRGEPLLEATAGRASRDFIHRHPPGQHGIGRQAMEGGDPQWIDDPNTLRSTHPGLYEEGIRAFAAFPLAFGSDARGILYVHFWEEHQITPVERELEGAFAQQMEVAIKNSLLMKDVADYAEKAWMISGLQKVIHSLASGSKLPLVIGEVTRSSLYMLGADCVSLYEYFEKEKRFNFPPAMSGTFIEKDHMQTEVKPGDVVWQVIERGESLFISHAQVDPLISGGRTDGLDKPRFVKRERIESLAALVLRAGPSKERVGVMFVNYRQGRDFPEEDQRVMTALGSSVAIAMQSVRLHDQVQGDLSRRNMEVEALREIDRRISSDRVGDLRRILELILQKAVEIIGASAGSVWRLNKVRRELDLEAVWPNRVQQQFRIHSIGEGAIGVAAKEERSVLVKSLCELAVPLKDTQGVIGVIQLQLTDRGAFTEKDQALLETFAVLSVTAVHVVDEYRQLNEQIQSFRSLCLIEARIQDAGNDLEMLLQMLTTGITAQQGLGFSRAMVFLTDDDDKCLKGVTAVGALTRSEAEVTWKNIEIRVAEMKAQEKNQVSILSAFLKEAEEHALAVKDRRVMDRPLCKVIKSISIPLSTHRGAIRSAFDEGKVAIVEDGQLDGFRRFLDELSGVAGGSRAFVCVPLIGNDKRKMGVLVADNLFLPCEREIDRAKIPSLEAFAGVAAMSIENAKLRDAYRHEAERAEQRAESFREVLAQTAHEFRSPLQNIFGQIPLLRKNVTPGASISISSIILGIEDEVLRAKKVMEDSLAFGAGLTYNYVPSLLRPILEVCCQEYENRAAERNLRIVVWDSAKRLAKLEMDPERIRQVITNLLDNAVKYSFNGERIHIRGQDMGNSVQLSLEDSGLGIPAAQQKRIFGEFVRQVVADRQRFIPGTGVGLKVVHDIITAHEGSIEVSSVPFLDDPRRHSVEDGHKVTFTITLPKVRRTR